MGDVVFVLFADDVIADSTGSTTTFSSSVTCFLGSLTVAVRFASSRDATSCFNCACASVNCVSFLSSATVALVLVPLLASAAASLVLVRLVASRS